MKEKVVSTEEVVQVVEKKIYIADDGTEFTSVTECEEYECILAQLEKIEQCKDYENCPPFDGAEHTENCYFCWYRPKNRAELDVLEKRYTDQTFGNELIDQWICVEDDGCGSSWVSLLSDSIAYAQSMLNKLGYKSIVGSKPAVWSIKTEWASDYGADITTGSDVMLYADEKDARVAFEKAVADELERLPEDYKIVRDSNSFETYVEGNYPSNHSVIRLKKLPVF